MIVASFALATKPQKTAVTVGGSAFVARCSVVAALLRARLGAHRVRVASTSAAVNLDRALY